MVNVTICTSREGNGNACYIMAASPSYHQMFVTIISTSQQKMRKNKNIDYYFCITSMQKIKRFIKDIPFKRVLICKTIQKGSKSWNSSQIWLFFKTYKCIFKTQNSWHFFCYTDTVCCLQNLFQLGWLGTRQAYYKINVAIAASCSKFLGQILYDFEGMLAYRIDIKGFLRVEMSKF